MSMMNLRRRKTWKGCQDANWGEINSEFSIKSEIPDHNNHIILISCKGIIRLGF